MADMGENSLTKAPSKGKGRHRPWRPGESGNPRGKPVGCKHKTTMAVEALLNGEAEKLTRKAVGLALDGERSR
jgi:hypothetical protein